MVSATSARDEDGPTAERLTSSSGLLVGANLTRRRMCPGTKVFLERGKERCLIRTRSSAKATVIDKQALT